MKMETKDLIKQSEVNRRRLMEIIYKAGAGHTGGDLSVMNLMTVLYFDIMNVNPDDPKMPERDRFVLSKGHCVEALYTVLEARGFIKPGVLDTLGQFGSVLSGHPTIEVPGIEVNTGALGHGLPIGVGMAIAAKMDGKTYKTYVVMGDGELAEGSNWEGFMSGAMYKLDNLCAVIDRNILQISGSTEDVMAEGDLAGKLRAFGWHVIEIDGHDFAQIKAALAEAKTVKSRPTMILAKTVKGKGVSFMENQVGWHGKAPNDEQYATAMAELEKIGAAL